MLSGNNNELPFPVEVLEIIIQHMLNDNGLDETLAFFLLSKQTYALFMDPQFTRHLTLYFRDVDDYYPLPFSEMNRALMSAYLEKKRYNEADLQRAVQLFAAQTKQLALPLYYRDAVSIIIVFVVFTALLSKLFNVLVEPAEPFNISWSVILTIGLYLTGLRVPLPAGRAVREYDQLQKKVVSMSARKEWLKNYEMECVYPDIVNFFYDKNKYFLFSMNDRCKLRSMPAEILKLISHPETDYHLILMEPVTFRNGVIRSELWIDKSDYHEGIDYYRNVNLGKIIKALILCYRDDVADIVKLQAFSDLEKLLICPVKQELLVNPVLLSDGTHVCGVLGDNFPDYVVGKIARLFPFVIASAAKQSSPSFTPEPY